MTARPSRAQMVTAVQQRNDLSRQFRKMIRQDPKAIAATLLLGHQSSIQNKYVAGNSTLLTFRLVACAFAACWCCLIL